MKNLLLVCTLCLFVVSCASTPQVQLVEVTRSVELTRLVEVTKMVEVTRLVVVTATDAPTPTSAPTSTAIPFFVYHAADVIAAFKAAGLPAQEGSPDKPGGPSPSTESEVIRFLVPLLGPNNGGRVFAFDSQRNLDAKRAYYESFTGFLFSWVFTHNNILVQINGSLPKAEADKYNAALQAIP